VPVAPEPEPVVPEVPVAPEPEPVVPEVPAVPEVPVAPEPQVPVAPEPVAPEPEPVVPEVPVAPEPEPVPPLVADPDPLLPEFPQLPPVPEPTPEIVPLPTPAEVPGPVAPAAPVDPIVGTWRIQPITLGEITYTRTTMVIAPDGSASLVDRDEDACNWQVGSPVFRNLVGDGTTYTGERYIGPCVAPPADWQPVTATLSPDGTTLTETVASTAQTRTWVKIAG
jgi:hypothetical protein